MRKSFLFVLLSLLFGLPMHVAAGVDIKVTGSPAMCWPKPQGVDSVFIIADLSTAMLETYDANPTWWKYQNGDSAIVSTGINNYHPEHNTGYILHTNEGRITFWVLDYTQCKTAIHGVEINEEYDNLCEETELLLEAIIPEMSYQDIYGVKHTIDRTCQVQYQSLAWAEEEWGDSLCIETPRLRNVIKVGAPLQNTVFTICDNQFTANLGLAVDSISTHLYEARAIAAHPTTITTTRGENEENEPERPIEDTQLSGSAPLDIYFKANATPAVKYYQWQILKGSDLIAQRTDAEQRYTFEEYGEYRALLWVSNDHCKTDSIEIKISVATSQLLVPNVFTPNGDGVNDEFRVMYRSIVDFHCWVYNRWGHKVFDWTDPAKGWDGTINGREAAESAYFYVIRATGADGTKYELKGDINLIRGKKK